MGHITQAQIRTRWVEIQLETFQPPGLADGASKVIVSEREMKVLQIC
jgi:hypothetical protein